MANIMGLCLSKAKSHAKVKMVLAVQLTMTWTLVNKRLQTIVHLPSIFAVNSIKAISIALTITTVVEMITLSLIGAPIIEICRHNKSNMFVSQLLERTF